jgi:cytoskeletal protein CcmA (bactofilin family)
VKQESVRRDEGNPSRANELPSIVAPELHITGKVASDGVVHVEGRIDGEVECAELVVGVGGRIMGDIVAERVYIRGSVNGTIRAKTIRLGSGSVVDAEVIHETLTVEHGARLNGFFRPVRQVDGSSAVDVREHIRRPDPNKSALPRRRAPSVPAGTRAPASLRLSGDRSDNLLY